MKTCIAVLGILFEILTSCYCAFGQTKPRWPKLPPRNLYTGYIIDTKGDSINCQFKKPNSDLLKYRLDTTERFRYPSTDLIRRYYSTYDSTVHISMLIDTFSAKPEFVKRLENGVIKLYQQEVYASGGFTNGMIVPGSTDLNFYVTKNDGPLKLLKTSGIMLFNGTRKSRREYLYDLFSDDPSLAEKFKKEKFNLKTFRRYISLYNADKTGRSK